MQIEFDPAKEAANFAKHRISLARAADMTMLSVKRDERFDYREERFRAWGPINGEDYCFAFTIRGGVVRAISLRRAHAKEMRKHAP
jgi:hypothetical protein